MFDKTDKELTLDEETKNFTKEIKKLRKECCLSRDLQNILATTTLVNNLLGQNAQDLRKSLDKIKQQKVKLNKDERIVPITTKKMMSLIIC